MRKLLKLNKLLKTFTIYKNIFYNENWKYKNKANSKYYWLVPLLPTSLNKITNL